MEMVDVVDKNNQVIGRISKKEAHEKGLLHRCIIAEVINSNNCNLLVKQSAD